MNSAELQTLKPGSFVTVLSGRTKKQTARFVKWSKHPRHGDMLLIEKKDIKLQSGWTNPVAILPCEVLEVVGAKKE